MKRTVFTYLLLAALLMESLPPAIRCDTADVIGESIASAIVSGTNAAGSNTGASAQLTANGIDTSANGVSWLITAPGKLIGWVINESAGLITFAIELPEDIVAYSVKIGADILEKLVLIQGEGAETGLKITGNMTANTVKFLTEISIRGTEAIIHMSLFPFVETAKITNEIVRSGFGYPWGIPFLPKIGSNGGGATTEGGN